MKLESLGCLVEVLTFIGAGAFIWITIKTGDCWYVLVAIILMILGIWLHAEVERKQ